MCAFRRDDVKEIKLGGDHSTAPSRAHHSHGDFKLLFPRSISKWKGKDRHSKVLTSKGVLRDRRVRLSLSTAIRFYDIQDRLGFDQPSKAIEWLLDKSQWALDSLPVLSHKNTVKGNAKDLPYEESGDHIIQSFDLIKDANTHDVLSSITSDHSSQSRSSSVFKSKYQSLYLFDDPEKTFKSNTPCNTFCAIDENASYMDPNNEIDIKESVQRDNVDQNSGSTFSERVLERGNGKKVDGQSMMLNHSEVEKPERNSHHVDMSPFELQSPILFINQTSYLYCSSPRFM
ncbi:hypothetical protein KP509_20G025200 [Ceratopteris richardii]|uniref:TCP domain-containing protein n=1 Tax=Ceratopteris richardii TaxID=49495 RepID=A0A8T2SFR4_CERRI|nr:hypothetical protein KP509_20G025200 [Ceratopteris richardii]